MAAAFADHLAWAEKWLAETPSVTHHVVDYNHIVHYPLAGAGELAAFLPFPLDVAAMASAVDPALYRQRGHGDHS